MARESNLEPKFKLHLYRQWSNKNEANVVNPLSKHFEEWGTLHEASSLDKYTRPAPRLHVTLWSNFKNYTAHIWNAGVLIARGLK